MSYPVIEKGSGCSPYVPGLGIAIRAGSREPEAAWELASFLVSEEHQLRLARSGHMPVIRHTRVGAEFGADVPLFQGKNTAAFACHPSAPTVRNKRVSGWNGAEIVHRGLVEMAYRRLEPERVLAGMHAQIQDELEQRRASALDAAPQVAVQ